MRWLVLTPGKPKLPFAAEGMAFYAKRLERFAEVELRVVRAESIAASAAAADGFRIALDERGESLSSTALAERLEEWRARGTRRFCLFAGAADGLPPSAREEADFVWSLSPGVLQHELALVIALEQLYRACCINTNHPYHRQ